MAGETGSRARLPAGVVALGLVSLFMDVSSEMVHGLLPVFLTGTLGASALVVGLIEGLGEGLAQIVKLFSGLWSDRLGRRKPVAVLGYGLSALTKPMFALAGGAGLVLAARLTDRLGKGIRGAPRDALLADLVPPAQRGAAYGLRQSLDTVGAVNGPLLAIALMAWSGGAFRLVFALAILPALVSVAILAFAVREPEQRAAAKAKPRLDRASLAGLGRGFWALAGLGGLLTLARISEAFLILRASEAGLAPALAPAVLIAMNLVYAASAWPAGVLSDRIGARGLLATGFGLLVVADLVLALAPGLAGVAVGVTLWGLHMGLSQGLLAAMVADRAPAALRGTAFGAFNLVSGLAVLVGNSAAGLVWSRLGSGAVFLGGAALAATALVAFLAWSRGRGSGQPGLPAEPLTQGRRQHHQQDADGGEAPDRRDLVRAGTELAGKQWPDSQVKQGEPPGAISQGQGKDGEHVAWEPPMGAEPVLDRHQKPVEGDLPGKVPAAGDGAEPFTAERVAGAAGAGPVERVKLQQDHQAGQRRQPEDRPAGADADGGGHKLEREGVDHHGLEGDMQDRQQGDGLVGRCAALVDDRVAGKLKHLHRGEVGQGEGNGRAVAPPDGKRRRRGPGDNHGGGGSHVPAHDPSSSPGAGSTRQDGPVKARPDAGEMQQFRCMPWHSARFLGRRGAPP